MFGRATCVLSHQNPGFASPQWLGLGNKNNLVKVRKIFFSVTKFNLLDSLWLKLGEDCDFGSMFIKTNKQ